MKKTLVALLIAIMSLTLVACGGDKEEAKDEVKNDEAKTQETFTYAIQSDTGNTLNYFTTDTREGMSFINMINKPLFTLAADGSYNFYTAESFVYADSLFSDLINQCDTNISIVDYTNAKDELESLVPKTSKEKLKVFVSSKEFINEK